MSKMAGSESEEAVITFSAKSERTSDAQPNARSSAGRFADLRERLLESVGFNAGNDSSGLEAPGSRQAKVGQKLPLDREAQFARKPTLVGLARHRLNPASK
ncbi:hypothetical protein [Variovorax sp. 22077]|uniref:hypothetical protein n=1 Tax=Variovorax sp. 22077 TaxID=3453867 RepID=UPI003F84473A